jgi:hypothetical protein
MVVSKRLGSGAGVNHAFLQLDLEQKLKFNVVVVKHCGLVRLCRLVMVSSSGGSSEEATEAVPPQIKLNKKKIKNTILN